MKKRHFLRQAAIVVCLVVIICTVAVTLSACNTERYQINDLYTELTLNEDGSVRVSETHVVDWSTRDADWWNYYKRIGLRDEYGRSEDEGYANEGNIVSELSDFVCTVDGANYPVNDRITRISDIDSIADSSSKQERYAGSSYVAYSGYTVEIGVIMPAFSSGTKTVTFSYTLSNLMISYADCSGLYYKFIDETNEVPVKNFRAKINFKNKVTEDNVAIWTHIEDGNAGNFLSEDGMSVTYEGNDVSAGVYLETRILFFDGGYASPKTNKATKAEMIAQEKAWEEDFLRLAKISKIVNIADIVVTILILGGAIALLFVFSYKLKPIVFSDKPEYVRDIPVGYTAGEMAPLYHYYGKKDYISDSFSATMMELCRMKLIEIRVGEKKKEAEIFIANAGSSSFNDDLFGSSFGGNIAAINGLRPHEKQAYDMLVNASNALGGSFTMKEFEKYAKKNSEKFAKQMEKYKQLALQKTTKMGCYSNRKNNKIIGATAFIGVGSFILGVLAFFARNLLSFTGISIRFLPFAFIIVGIVYFVYNVKKKTPLTELGQREYDDFEALGKFMTDFSKMDEHEIPELVLWEEYLVYATAMGIADKVSEQLEAKYPEYREIVERGYTTGNVNDAFICLYLCSPRVRMNSGFAVNTIMRSINNDVKQANIRKNVSKYTGGSGGKFGGGGGFRGGGGGFHGGGMGSR